MSSRGVGMASAATRCAGRNGPNTGDLRRRWTHSAKTFGSGLYNDRHLDECLAEEVGPAHCYSLPLSLLMIDFDGSCVLRDRSSRLRSRPDGRGSWSERG